MTAETAIIIFYQSADLFQYSIKFESLKVRQYLTKIYIYKYFKVWVCREQLTEKYPSRWSVLNFRLNFF